MSSKKDKFLESAQRFILKGQIDRAIKDYEQIVALDPKEIRHRQRLAELLVRAGRKEEAIGEYDAIGKYYADNGYFLKAIAVYKQIQKLDPGNIKVTLTLASLNEKQGLIGNALAEYGLSVDYYEKNGQLSEALKVIEQMLAIDADNPATCQKYAEMLYVMGVHEKAYQTFTQLSQSLKKRGNEYAFEQVNARIGVLFPDRQEPSLEMLAEQVKNGDVENAIPKLSGLIKKDSSNLHAWKLLVEAYRLKEDSERLKLTFSLIIRMFPDELFAREGIINCAFNEGDFNDAVELLSLHVPYFEAQGAHPALEALYLKFLERSSDDGRIIAGLKSLYEKIGDGEKLAALESRLNTRPVILPAEEEPVDSEIPLTFDDADVAEEQTSAFPAEQLEAAETVITAESSEPSEPEWEEEIYLAIDDEGGEEAAAFVPEPEPVLQVEKIPAVDELDSAVEDEEVGAKLTFDTNQPIEFDFEESPLIPSDNEDDLLQEPAEEVAISEVLEPQEMDFPEPAYVSGEAETAEALNDSARKEEITSFAMGEPAEDIGEESALFSLDISEDMDEFLDQFDELLTLPLEAEPVVSAKFDKYSWDGMFSEFKKGIDAQVDVGDTETHYDLGIAYKEMGLFDDAIKEFQNASLNPQRKVDCLTLQAVCYREKGEFGMAEELLQNGIGLEELAGAELLSLKYELAFLYENSGRMDDAFSIYSEVNAVNPDFHGVAGKIALLKGVAETQEIIDLDLEDIEELDGEDETDGSGCQKV